MESIGRIFRDVKHLIRLYRAFRKLSHAQIEALVRQAELAKAAAKPAPPKSKVEFRLVRDHSGLPMLAEI